MPSPMQDCQKMWKNATTLFNNRFLDECLTALNTLIHVLAPKADLKKTSRNYQMYLEKRARCHSDLCQYDAARKDYEEISKNATEKGMQVLARQGLAAIHFYRQEFQLAVDGLTKIIKDKQYEQHVGRVHKDRALYYLEWKQYYAAIQDYNIAIKTSEGQKDFDIWQNRGRCHFLLKQYEQALSDFHKAFSLCQPKETYNLAHTHGCIVQCLLAYTAGAGEKENKPNYPQALITLAKAISMKDDEFAWVFLYKQAQIFALLGNIQQALDISVKAIQSCGAMRPYVFRQMARIFRMDATENKEKTEKANQSAFAAYTEAINLYEAEHVTRLICEQDDLEHEHGDPLNCDLLDDHEDMLPEENKLIVQIRSIMGDEELFQRAQTYLERMTTGKQLDPKHQMCFLFDFYTLFGEEQIGLQFLDTKAADTRNLKRLQKLVHDRRVSFNAKGLFQGLVFVNKKHRLYLAQICLKLGLVDLASTHCKTLETSDKYNGWSSHYKESISTLRANINKSKGRDNSESERSVRAECLSFGKEFSTTIATLVRKMLPENYLDSTQDADAIDVDADETSSDEEDTETGDDDDDDDDDGSDGEEEEEEETDDEEKKEHLEWLHEYFPTVPMLPPPPLPQQLNDKTTTIAICRTCFQPATATQPLKPASHFPTTNSKTSSSSSISTRVASSSSMMMCEPCLNYYKTEHSSLDNCQLCGADSLHTGFACSNDQCDRRYCASCLAGNLGLEQFLAVKNLDFSQDDEDGWLCLHCSKEAPNVILPQVDLLCRCIIGNFTSSTFVQPFAFPNAKEFGLLCCDPRCYSEYKFTSFSTAQVRWMELLQEVEWAPEDPSKSYEVESIGWGLTYYKGAERNRVFNKLISCCIFLSPKSEKYQAEFYKHFCTLFRNLELVKEVWPDWCVRVYFDHSLWKRNRVVSACWKELFLSLVAHPQVQLVQYYWPQYQDALGYHIGLMGTLVRFHALSDPLAAAVIVRDVDNLWTQHDAALVNHWLASDRTMFHRYHDPAYTWPLIAGFFGAQRGSVVGNSHIVKVRTGLAIVPTMEQDMHEFAGLVMSNPMAIAKEHTTMHGYMMNFLKDANIAASRLAEKVYTRSSASSSSASEKAQLAFRKEIRKEFVYGFDQVFLDWYIYRAIPANQLTSVMIQLDADFFTWRNDEKEKAGEDLVNSKDGIDYSGYLDDDLSTTLRAGGEAEKGEEKGGAEEAYAYFHNAPSHQSTKDLRQAMRETILGGGVGNKKPVLTTLQLLSDVLKKPKDWVVGKEGQARFDFHKIFPMINHLPKANEGALRSWIHRLKFYQPALSLGGGSGSGSGSGPVNKKGGNVGDKNSRGGNKDGHKKQQVSNRSFRSKNINNRRSTQSKRDTTSSEEEEEESAEGEEEEGKDVDEHNDNDDDEDDNNNSKNKSSPARGNNKRKKPSPSPSPSPSKVASSSACLTRLQSIVKQEPLSSSKVTRASTSASSSSSSSSTTSTSSPPKSSPSKLNRYTTTITNGSPSPSSSSAANSSPRKKQAVTSAATRQYIDLR